MRFSTFVLIALMLVMPATMLPQPPQRDRPFDVNQARQNLRDARAFLDQAGGEWGGHRVSAIKHIDAALGELNEAERWAHAHGDVR
jgi:hypothetical protein